MDRPHIWSRARTVASRVLLGGLLGGAGACSERTYVCSADAQCVWNGVMGWCEAQASVCAYPDDECSSMGRYGPYAGAVAGACVEPEAAASSSTGTGPALGTTTPGTTTRMTTAETSSSSGSTSGDTGDVPIPLPPITGTVWVVAPDGDDRAQGTPEDPFATLQRGLAEAMPGDGIELVDGEYDEGGTSVRAGEPDAPIVIYGSEGAVLHGTSSTILVIGHDHHVVHGLTIDGLHGDPGEADGYADQLLGIEGPDAGATVRGVRLLELTLRNAADECVRLRGGAQDNEIAGCTINDCGIRDFVFGNMEQKNGEGIFIGTPEDVWAGSPTGPDRCDANWIHDNDIDTRGNECVDIQEGSEGNRVEGNECRGQRDSYSGGISVRGNGNFVRGNTVQGCSGAGVRLGGDEADMVVYGVDNEVTDNRLVDNAAGGVKVQVIPQGSICGNVLESNGLGPSVGTYGDQFDPAGPC